MWKTSAWIILLALLLPSFESHECDAYSDQYMQIHGDLKHWYGVNITKAMMGRAIRQHSMHVRAAAGFAFFFESGKVYFHANDNLQRIPKHYAREITIHMQELQYVAEKYGYEIPNVEFVVRVDDVPSPMHSVLDPHGRLRPVDFAPIGKYFSTDGYAEVAVPGWGFKYRNFDEGVLKWAAGVYERHPWAARKDTLYGNYGLYKVDKTGAKATGEGYKTLAIRQYFTANVSRLRPDTVDVRSGRKASNEDHAGYKYVAVVDGIGPTNRFFEMLATGSLVFKETSPYRLHFEAALKPYRDYVPFWTESPWDAHNLVLWARANDDVARSIAESGYKFVMNNLHIEARACYWRELLRKLAPLLSYTPTRETSGKGLVVQSYDEISATESFRKANLPKGPGPDAGGAAAGGGAQLRKRQLPGGSSSVGTSAVGARKGPGLARGP